MAPCLLVKKHLSESHLAYTMFGLTGLTCIHKSPPICRNFIPALHKSVELSYIDWFLRVALHNGSKYFGQKPFGNRHLAYVQCLVNTGMTCYIWTPQFVEKGNLQTWFHFLWSKSLWQQTFGLHTIFGRERYDPVIWSTRLFLLSIFLSAKMLFDQTLFDQKTCYLHDQRRKSNRVRMINDTKLGFRNTLKSFLRSLFR